MSESRSAWANPGPEELGGGVYRIPLPLPNDGLRAVNIYVIETPDGLVLIDGGWALPESEQQLKTSLHALGFALADITELLVTHMHRDHFTQAIGIRREVGAKVSLGAGEEPNLAATMAWSQSGQPRERTFTHLLRAGATPLLTELRSRPAMTDTANPLDWQLPDVWLADGAAVAVGDRTLRVIATPGHTRGHVVYHDAGAKLLFAGDHVLPQITPSIGYEPARTPFPLRDYLDSLRLMQTLPDARLLPAHGPVTDSMQARVTELLDHHDARLSASAAVIAAGAATAYDTARALTWTRHERSFDSMDLENKMLAVSETAAHLDVLVLQGGLSSAENGDGVEIYQTL